MLLRKLIPIVKAEIIIAFRLFASTNFSDFEIIAKSLRGQLLVSTIFSEKWVIH